MPTRFLHIAFIATLLLSACERERIVDPGPDTTAPLPPTGVVVEGARDGYIFIGWLPGAERDLRGYVVHRAEGDAGATFTVVDTLTVNFIIDEQRSYDTTYFYYITAFDDVGNESVASAMVSARSENRYAPEATRQLSVNGYNDGVHREIRVSWSVVEEADLAGYRLYRSESIFSEADSTLLIAEIDAPFHDDISNVLPGSRYFYGVTAVDRGGWESPLSTLESDFIGMRPTLLSPAHGSKTVVYPMLRWRATDDAQQYLVSVSLSEQTGEVWNAYVSGNGHDTISVRYGGSALTPGERYFWRVSTVTAGNGKPNGISEPWRFLVDD